MIRVLLLSALTLFLGSNITAQNEQPPAEPDFNKAMEGAFDELSKMLDTLDTESLFGSGGLEGLFKGLSIEGEEMEDLNGALDSIGISELFGGDFSKMFKGGFPGMENMDMKEMEKMMEEGLGMMKGIDMNQFQKMLEGIDMSEMMKMFEGMGMDQFDVPTKPEIPTDSKGKKLKKI